VIPEGIKGSVIVFPGSNCDHDSYYALKKIIGVDTRFVWHKEESLGSTDLVILPGGFSYGDYLRCGAIARFSPIMKEIIRFANDGGVVIGICNGLQILCEAGLLPGALMRNRSLKFVCKDVYLHVANSGSIFTSGCHPGEVLKIPIAHGDGNYVIDQEGLEELQKNRQIIFQYCNDAGHITESANPNGSIFNIAGIMNKEGTILGMMPHPERAVDSLLGRTDGKKIFESVVKYLTEKNSYITA
jgi:phosphoribosylformylglycinamidine synthase subunit PurQ / glutaminase